jgi:hypothetical protein
MLELKAGNKASNEVVFLLGYKARRFIESNFV